MAISMLTMPLSPAVVAHQVRPAARDNAAAPAGDRYTPSSGNASAGIVSYKDMLKLKGSGTGWEGVQDANVAPAQKNAAAHANDKVDWKNPSTTLNHLTQIDGDNGKNKGGNDAVRCGAANLVAGAVLLGPEQTKKAMKTVAGRSDKLQAHYESMANSHPRGSGERKFLDGLVSELKDGEKTLRDLSKIPADKLTVGQMQQMQEAVYKVALLDQRLTDDGYNSQGNDPYLYAGTMQTYRQEMWGDKLPMMNGREIDMFWVDNAHGGGHFVLADKADSNGYRPVAFNPWPDSDGTAYSRGVDGGGALLAGEKSQMVEGLILGGRNIGELGQPLPALN